MFAMKKAEFNTENNENAANPEPGTDEALAPVEPAMVTPEQLEELKSRAIKAEEHWDRLLRLTADFDNFKKRAAREKQEAVRFANEGLIEKLVPVLDNFEIALAATAAAPQAGGSEEAVQSLHTGMSMIYQQLKSILAEAGLEEMNVLGQPFDPNWHEAVSQQETSEVQEGQVLQQLRKGYKLRDRLLRAATVIVAKAPAA
jgi:molecular chaperone GrpE